MQTKEIEKFFRTLAKANPEPKGELYYTNNYTLLIAVVLSAQMTDVGVNRATVDLFKVADTPQKMLDLGLDKLITYIKTIGLYKSKAGYIIKTSKLLIETYKGHVPKTREALESLPGVGRKTAERLLVEMKDKAGDWLDELSPEAVSDSEPGRTPATDQRAEAEQALVALGYKLPEAAKLVASIDVSDDMTSEQLIRLALRYAGGGK